MRTLNVSVKGGKSYQGMSNIPDLPFLIIVPLPLRAQVELEIHRYLRPNSFDVFVYDGGAKRNPTFWSQVFKASDLNEGARIVLTSMKASYWHHPMSPSNLYHRLPPWMYVRVLRDKIDTQHLLLRNRIWRPSFNTNG